VTCLVGLSRDGSWPLGVDSDRKLYAFDCCFDFQNMSFLSRCSFFLGS